MPTIPATWCKYWNIRSMENIWHLPAVARRQEQNYNGNNQPEPGTGLIRLWTIQSLEAWEQCRKTGVMRADGRRVARRYRDSYHWMMAQMKRRLPGYQGRFPIWAWAGTRPDLRTTGFLPRGSPGARLEFTVPVNRVLLSDFNAWHHVLNGWYLPLTQQEADGWAQACQLYPGSDCLRHWLLASWERIFDLDLLDRSELTAPVTLVQAVLEEIRLEEVNRVSLFTAR